MYHGARNTKQLVFEIWGEVWVAVYSERSKEMLPLMGTLSRRSPFTCREPLGRLKEAFVL